MSNATNYLEAQIINHLFRTATFAKPPAIYIGLLETITDGEVPTVTEASYPGYARQQVVQADANWTPPAGGTQRFSNANTITFPANTGVTPGDDQTLVGYGVYDAASGGNLLIYDTLAAPVLMEGGASAEPADFTAGQLGITFQFSTDALALLVGNHLLRANTWAKPATLTYHLYQTVPAQDGTGGVEVSGGSYAALNVGPADANWTAPDPALGTSNAVLFTFAVPTATWTINGATYQDGATILSRYSYAATRTRTAGSSACRLPIGRLTYVVD